MLELPNTALRRVSSITTPGDDDPGVSFGLFPWDEDLVFFLIRTPDSTLPEELLVSCPLILIEGFVFVIHCPDF
jgi:hypothetical protein